MRAIFVCTCESHLDKLKTVVQNEKYYSLFFAVRILRSKGYQLGRDVVGRLTGDCISAYANG